MLSCLEQMGVVDECHFVRYELNMDLEGTFHFAAALNFFLIYNSIATLSTEIDKEETMNDNIAYRQKWSMREYKKGM